MSTPKSYVVVQNPGTDKQTEIFECKTSNEAYARFNHEEKQDDEGVNTYDVMKRLPDGTLTTEF